jgi:hypothetical protein
VNPPQTARKGSVKARTDTGTFPVYVRTEIARAQDTREAFSAIVDAAVNGHAGYEPSVFTFTSGGITFTTTAKDAS